MKNGVADKIRLCRLSRNLSQQNMADELNLTVGAYSNLERGKADITLTRLYRIAEIFEIDIMELFIPIGPAIDEGRNAYGYASKTDIENLTMLMEQYRHEVGLLKKEIQELKKKAGAREKKK